MKRVVMLGVGLLVLAPLARAGTILDFGQTLPDSFVSSTVSGGTLNLDTHGGPSAPGSPGSIPISITQLGNTPLINDVPAFETFVGVTSSDVQVGADKGGFSGQVKITSLTGGAGTNFLTAIFSGMTLSLPSQGSGSLSDAEPPFHVTYTSASPLIQGLLAGTTGGTFSLALADITPPQVGTFTDFTAQNSGVFSSGAIPEPRSILLLAWVVPLWFAIRYRLQATPV